jgi:spermidine synthase
MAAIAGSQTPFVVPAYSLRTLKLIALCFLLSGATGLIYEVLWARMLGLVFGATTIAISAVISAFMGGLALGSALASKSVSRISRPVRAYGLIEVSIGLYALTVPFLFRGIDWAYVEAWQHLHPGFYRFALARFALAAIVLVVPTTLMGATLPVLAATVGTGNENSNIVTRLYTCNLVGAIIGTIAAGFLLLPSLGVQKTIWFAASINLAIGIAAVLIEGSAQRSAAVKMPNSANQTKDSNVNAAFESRGFWLFCAFISGFVTISMQIVWSRLLSMIIGSSTYAFSIVLALFLGGLSVGAYLGSLLKNRSPHQLRRSLPLIQFMTAASLFLSLPVTNVIPRLLVGAGFRLGINSWSGLLALQVVAAMLLILLPAILMGLVMPLVLRWAEAGRAGKKEDPGPLPASRVGQSYAINTIGAIAGSIVTAFLLIPKTNTRFTIFCVTSLSLIVAALAYEPRSNRSDRALSRSLAIGAAALLILLTFVFWPRLNLNALSSGAYDSYVRVLAKSRGGVPANEQSDQPDSHKLLMFDEGKTATVSVRRDWGITSMAINGRTNGSDGEDMPTQIMVAQLGILTAPRLDNALIVGFATGVTPGSVLQSSIKSVDCVEIEPAAVTSSHFFEHVNKLPLNDPRLNLILDDARTYLRVNSRQYDLIVSEPSHPWVAGVANLFTREFFRLGRDRLKTDGVFVQWVQTYQLSTESLRSVLATFNEVFPNIALFRVEGSAKGKDLILLGSRTRFNFEALAARINEPGIATELARAGIYNAEDLRSWLVCDETRLGPAVAGAPINTDDNMHVETIAPREAFRASLEKNAEWIERLRGKNE